MNRIDTTDGLTVDQIIDGFYQSNLDPDPYDAGCRLASEILRLRRETMRPSLRELLVVWLTGDCPMGQDGCRTRNLCEHCFENAIVDFDLEAD